MALLQLFKCVCKVTKREYQVYHVSSFFHTPKWDNSALSEKILVKCYVCDCYSNLLRKCSFGKNGTKISGNLRESALCVYDNISLHYSWFDPGGRAAYGMCLRQFALLGMRFRISLVAWMPICCDGCAVLGRRLCDSLIPCPEESYKPKT